MVISDIDIRPYVLPLIGFTDRRVNLSGIVNLPMHNNGTTWYMEFLVIDTPSYNNLIGRPAHNHLKATMFLTLEVRTTIGFFAIRDDRSVG